MAREPSTTALVVPNLITAFVSASCRSLAVASWISPCLKNSAAPSHRPLLRLLLIPPPQARLRQQHQARHRRLRPN